MSLGGPVPASADEMRRALAEVTSRLDRHDRWRAAMRSALAQARETLGSYPAISALIELMHDATDEEGVPDLGLRSELRIPTPTTMALSDAAFLAERSQVFAVGDRVVTRTGRQTPGTVTVTGTGDHGDNTVTVRFDDSPKTIGVSRMDLVLAPPTDIPTERLTRLGGCRPGAETEDDGG